MGIYQIKRKKVVLIILDGFGEDSPSAKNAISLAKTPTFDFLFRHYPNIKLNASGLSVGLPEGVMGNSEVGHLTIGAGRNIRLDLVRINEDISSDKYATNLKMKEFFELDCSGFHLMILLSDGQVHSSIFHLKETIKSALLYTKKTIYLHAFMDGRDTPPKSGITYVQEIMDFIKNQRQVIFASMMGRSIAMDRDKRWEKTQCAFEALTNSNKVPNEYVIPMNPIEYLKKKYQENYTDEFIPCALFSEEYKISKSSAVFFLNFRADRTRQLTSYLCDDSKIAPMGFMCMSNYFDYEEMETIRKNYSGKFMVAYDREKISLGLSEEISNAKLLQCKIAETEKYAHVTYFFNGGSEIPFEGEERILVSSPREVPTYDLVPQMSAYKLTEHLLEKMQDPDLSFIVINYANADMVGHTGNMLSTIKAIEVLDECMGKVYQLAKQENIDLIITADHGNADKMLQEDNLTPHTAHTTALVPFLLVTHPQRSLISHKDSSLRDIAPSVMDLLELKCPTLFTGKSLLN